MFKFNKIKLAIGLSAIFLLLAACNSTVPSRSSVSANQKTGVQLWADNCSRCHNMRPPDSYSDAQWDVAILHMRIRANLSGADARAIAEYLKAAN